MSTSFQAPTAFEFEMFDLINRTRLDPGGIAVAMRDTALADADLSNALRYFGTDLTAFETDMSNRGSLAPLAWNGALAQAAEGHSRLLIETDSQSHQVFDENGNALEPKLSGRVEAAGYDAWTSLRENVYSYTQSAYFGHAGFVIDWGQDSEDFDSSGNLHSDWQTRGDGMQDPAGHRESIMSTSVTEIGIAALAAPSGLSVGPWVVTQNFGNRIDTKAQLVGAVIRDMDGDGTYDSGEGLGGVRVTATGASGSFTTTSWASGGYQLELSEGRWTIDFAGKGIAGTARYEIIMGAENLKLDGFAADARVVSPPGTVARIVEGTDDADVLRGTDGQNQILIGQGGTDRLLAGNGNDVLLGDLFMPDLAPDLAGQVFRLYRATLGRDPDAAGLRSWSGQLFEEEATLSKIVGGFTGSAEFRQTYGALSDGQFVELLYNNVLERSSDAAGLASWVDRLVSGSSRSDVVLGFSESAELKNATQTASTQFATRHSEADWTDEVYRLYGASLGREPDMAGLRAWSARLADGLDPDKVAAGFTNSPEFAVRFGAPGDGAFVDLLYGNVLGRAADAAGRDGWVAQLAGGTERSALLNGFANSPEYIKTTEDALEGFMRAGGTDDWLSGGGGSNRLAGGAGADVFAFSAAQGGTHEVLDFEAWDTLRFEGFGHASAAGARAGFRQEGDDLVYASAEVTVRVRDASLPMLEGQAIEIA